MEGVKQAILQITSKEGYQESGGFKSPESASQKENKVEKGVKCQEKEQGENKTSDPMDASLS